MYLKYLWYVIRHKWFVFLECCKLGIPWLGFVHDLSKLFLGEFISYARYFYGDYPKATIAWRQCLSYTGPTKERVALAFDMAWLFHQKRNRHHWQYWIFREDNPEPKAWAEWIILANVNTCFHVFPMPDRYCREMLADWRGAGIAITGKDNTQEWYKENKDRVLLHRTTRNWIEEQLNA